MTVVVDASVALKWILDEPDSDLARLVLDQPLIAPDWWLVEAANGLWKALARREITVDEAKRGLRDLSGAPVKSVAAIDVLDDALTLSGRLNHPVYDCLYLALAAREGGRLVTADNVFLKSLRGDQELLGHAVSLADFHP